MSLIYRCDRCGAYQTQKSLDNDNEGWGRMILGDVESDDDDADDDADLCPACYKYIQAWRDGKRK